MGTAKPHGAGKTGTGHMRAKFFDKILLFEVSFAIRRCTPIATRLFPVPAAKRFRIAPLVAVPLPVPSPASRAVYFLLSGETLCDFLARLDKRLAKFKIIYSTDTISILFQMLEVYINEKYSEFD